MDQNNGGILGKINTPTKLVASGVWSLDSQFEAQSSSIWPLAFPQTTIANSLRFNSGSSDYLSRTPSSTGNRRTFTISCWVKRSTLTASGKNIMVAWSGAKGSSSFGSAIYFNSSDQIEVDHDISGSDYTFNTDMVFRDVSAWYHIVLAVDTTQATESNRQKIYVNGSQVALTESALGFPTQNFDTYFNYSGGENNIGSDYFTAGYADQYMAEMVMVDGQALEPTSFGAFNPVTNIWEPIGYGGTYGTNGFRLDFADSSALGNDVSGNDNDFTVQNLTSLDQSTDTCSNNFMTLTPLSTDSGVTLSEGNTESDYDGSVGNAKGNIGLTKGRWYWEVKLTNSTSGYPMIGIGSMNESQMQKPTGGSYPGGFSNSYGVYGTNLRLYANGSNLGEQGSSYTTGDIFGIYLDLESSTKTIKWYKNGSSVLSYDITNAGEDYPFTCMDYNGGESSINVNYNFGNPAYTISSGNADDNGYGNFEYSPNISSTKYYAVCTKNLAEFGG